MEPVTIVAVTTHPYSMDPMAMARAIRAALAAAMLLTGGVATAPVFVTGPGRQGILDRPADPGYVVIGVGDVMPGSDWPEPKLDPRIAPGSDPAAVIGESTVRMMADADIVFGNFEGTIHALGGARRCRDPKLCHIFRSPPWMAGWLRQAGFTLMSQANNHAGDFGAAGRAASLRALLAGDIGTAGADMPSSRFAFRTLPDGTRVGLAAFGHNAGLMRVDDLATVRRRVGELAAAADIAIVSCHAGAEGNGAQAVPRAPERYIGEDRGDVFAFARAAVDAGADIVFCHGPHVPRAIDVYRDRFIAYSLGNFWTYRGFSLTGASTLAPAARLRVSRDGRLLDARIVSFRQAAPGGPVPDPDGAAARRIAMLTARDIPDAGIRIDRDGMVLWPGARWAVRLPYRPVGFEEGLAGDRLISTAARCCG